MPRIGLNRWVRRGLIALGCLALGLGGGYTALLHYLQWRETVSPSTARVLVLQDGRQIPLVQPSPAGDCGECGGGAPPPSVQSQRPPAPPPADNGPATPAAPAGTATPAAASGNQAAQAAVLPPERVRIPRIGVDWPVVLSDINNLPRFQGVGWLFGSAYPGAAGNVVLYGHLDGKYNTFGRLHELKAGDEFSVLTADQSYRYRVNALVQVAPDDVSVMAPTSGPTATLITCSGRWDPLLKMYDHRLVVTAAYIGP